MTQGQRIQLENGPVLVFGGPYGNLQATQAMQARCNQLGIPACNVICTGDTVAYCAQPQESVDLLRDWGIHVLMGNCEESLALDADDCACGFDEGSACSLLSAQWYPFNKQALNADSKRWMGQLPRLIKFGFGELEFCCVHGSYSVINEFVFASSDRQYKQAELERSGADVILGGHCGLPFGQALDRGYWLNAGVIGMPANNACASTWYLILSPEDKGVHAQWYQLEYPFKETMQLMAGRQLKNGYHDALETGVWPSHDILPAEEMARSGQPLAMDALWLRGP